MTTELLSGVFGCMDVSKTMGLDEAIAYAAHKVNNGVKSDGCTFSPELGINKFCVMHDMLRRFAPPNPVDPMTAFEADNLFFQGIMTKGWRYLPVAVFYWCAVRLEHYIGFGGIFSMIFFAAFVLWAYS